MYILCTSPVHALTYIRVIFRPRVPLSGCILFALRVPRSPAPSVTSHQAPRVGSSQRSDCASLRARQLGKQLYSPTWPLGEITPSATCQTKTVWDITTNKHINSNIKKRLLNAFGYAQIFLSYSRNFPASYGLIIHRFYRTGLKSKPDLQLVIFTTNTPVTHAHFICSFQT